MSIDIEKEIQATEGDEEQIPLSEDPKTSTQQDRRGWLKKGLVVTMAAAGAALTSTEMAHAQATVGFQASGTEIGVEGDSEGGFGLVGLSSTGIGIFGRSISSIGVLGTGIGSRAGVRGENAGNGNGVEGTSSIGAGVQGSSTNASGVLGSSTSGIGVVGNGNAGGVQGNSTGGIGAQGNSATGIGVLGNGGSIGVIASSSNGNGIFAASTNGIGVFASSTNGTAILMEGGIQVIGNRTGTPVNTVRMQAGAIAGTHATAVNAFATEHSTILLTPLGDPGGPLWISIRGTGSFVISRSGTFPLVDIAYLIIN